MCDRVLTIRWSDGVRRICARINNSIANEENARTAAACELVNRCTEAAAHMAMEGLKCFLVKVEPFDFIFILIRDVPLEDHSQW